MSCHVVFLEHIPSFSIPYATHGLTRSNLIRIDPFFKNYDGEGFKLKKDNIIPMWRVVGS